MSLTNELESIATRDDFEQLSLELLKNFRTDDVATNLNLVREILRFMEGHRSVNFGLPGNLAVFAEKFFGLGYEALLVESVNRMPVAYNLALLVRVINVTEGRRKQELLDVLSNVIVRDGVDVETKDIAREFFEYP